MDSEDNKKNNSKQILLSVLGVAILIVAVVGISFAAFTFSQAGKTTNTITTGTVTMAYTESENGINIENAVPLTDQQGKDLTGDNNVFDFSVSATITGDTTINYEIVAVKASVNEEGCIDPSTITDATTEEEKANICKTIPDKDIRLYLEHSDTEGAGYTPVFETPAAFVATYADDEDHKSEFGAPAGSMQLAQGTFSGSADGTSVTTTKYYRLRMWVAQSYKVTGTPQIYKVRVNVYGKGQ